MQKESNIQLARAEKCFEGLVGLVKPDHDLTKAYDEALTRAQKLIDKSKNSGMMDELELIKKCVVEASVAHAQAKEATRPQPNGGKRGKDHSFTNLSIEKRQDILRAISIQLDSFPVRELRTTLRIGLTQVALQDPNNCDLVYFSYEDAVRVRASYTYHYMYALKRKPSRFPFDVAMRELCLAKARARPGWHAVASHIHDAMRVRKA